MPPADSPPADWWTPDRLTLVLSAAETRLDAGGLCARPLGLVRAVRGWGFADLASHLRVPTRRLLDVYLCRTPVDRAGCDRVAARCGADAARLANLLGLGGPPARAAQGV